MAWFSFRVFDEQRQAHVQQCAQVASIAHWSSVIPIMAFSCVSYLRYRAHVNRLSGLSTRCNGVEDTRVSPSTRFSHENKMSRIILRLRWWIAYDIHIFGLYAGRADTWGLGIIWSCWVLWLCAMCLRIGSFQISHLLTLPDQHALHFSQCLGSVSASLFPASALLASTIVNPFSIYQLWPTSLFKRYHRVVVIIACTLYVTHMMIAFTRIDLEPVGQTLLLSLWTMVLVSMALKHLLNYRQIKFVPRIDIGARAAIIVIMVLHAPLTRIYVLETLLIIFVACGLKADVSIESRPVAQQNTSGTDRSSTNKDNPSEQYVLLQPYSPVSPESPPSPGTAHVLVEYKSKVAFTLQNNPALFTTLYAKLARLVLPRVDSPDTLQQDSGCVAMFSAKHNPTSDERMAIFFKGEHSISRDMLYLLDTHTVARILIIASGISGYLAYPAYYDTLRRRASANVQFCLALGVKPRIWPKPRRVLKLQILETTDDKICLYGSSAENKIATIEAIIRDAVTLDGRLMVLVFGPESLAIKTRVHLRPWAVRRGDIELHHINCEKS